MELVLLTGSYPYDSAVEQNFLDRELPYLAEKFDKITLVPKSCEGNLLPVPVRTNIDISLALLLQNRSTASAVTQAVTSRYFYLDLLRHPSILLSPNALKRCVAFVSQAVLTKRWAEEFIGKNQIDLQATLFYTFWFEQVAMGIGMAGEKYTGIKLISRAHGYDVYEERYSPPYWPCRIDALSKLNNLFLASDDAHHYMATRYPVFSNRLETMHLGVNQTGIGDASRDDCFRIVSCSFIVPVKRVELLGEGILLAAQARPNQKIEWRHIGDGLTRILLKEKFLSTFPANVTLTFDGYMENSDLMQYYSTNPVDIFVNTSQSEGIPVSIMEAISCGIPVLATNVGGNPEIVSDRNGWLLTADPTPEEVASKLLDIIDQPQSLAEKRKGSLEVWEDSFNAQKNFTAFANRLVEILTSE